ncbi:hypothetical protein GB937_003896 [Aspergillus fischeri]|nr:hypothetical protein GB937_003896 [Aspergillus fischeri]
MNDVLLYAIRFYIKDRWAVADKLMSSLPRYAFLKQARFLPYKENPDYSFFYFMAGLVSSEGLLLVSEQGIYLDNECFIFLYYTTTYKAGDQQGIL